MEQKGTLNLRTIQEKKEIYNKVLLSVKDAFEKDEAVYFIPDLMVFGEKMTCKLAKELWLYSLDKARLFFHKIEEYETAKECRDLIKQIKEKHGDLSTEGR